MTDDFAPSDARRNTWEPVLCEPEASALFTSNPQNEQSSDKPVSFYTSDLLNMDYFAAPSTVQPEMEDCVVASMASSQTGKRVESPPLANPELDWIEPSTPIRCCVIGTSEDDSSSRSCSSDSREGSSEPLSREKDGDPYIGDYTVVLHDVPMDDREESQAEVSGVLDDEGGGNEAPWRCCLGAWLSEAGCSSTFCSIALAAAVIGLVLVGSGWHRVRLQFQRFRCPFSSNGKGISQVMYQLVHIKGSSLKLRRIPVRKAQSCF